MGEKFTPETRILFDLTPAVLSRVMCGTLFNNRNRGYNVHHTSPWTLSFHFPIVDRWGVQAEVSASHIHMSSNTDRGQYTFQIISSNFSRVVKESLPWLEWSRTIRTTKFIEIQYITEFRVKDGVGKHGV